CYVIDPTRSHQPAEQLLGLDWSGTLVHAGWSVYDRFTQAFHQPCVRQVARRRNLVQYTYRRRNRRRRSQLRFMRACSTSQAAAYNSVTDMFS
ncbi:MAG TPA: transposase, partial [Pirellulales bacterium]|nr:transposase [Pirellulales bacterium]